ncbi:hypothetical protein LCGC14_2992920, partial [marine sediment metagenome]
FCPLIGYYGSTVGRAWFGEAEEDRIAKDLLAACKAQSVAIDLLFAMLIDQTEDGPEWFLPSKSGVPWEALLQGNAAVKRAEAMPGR